MGRSVKLSPVEAANELMCLVERIKFYSEKADDGSVSIAAHDLAEVNKEAVDILLRIINDPVIIQVFSSINQLFEVYEQCEDTLKID